MPEDSGSNHTRRGNRDQNSPPRQAIPAAGRSIEPSPLVFLVRRLVVLSLGAGLIAGVWLLATDRLAVVGGAVPSTAAPSNASPSNIATTQPSPPAAAPVETVTNASPAGGQSAIPARASRFVAGRPVRLLDTRTGPQADTHRLSIDDGSSAVALSISLIASQRSGQVVVDGSAGRVTAITIDGSGQTSDNLVIVPVVGSTLTVESSAGGQLVIDAVGTFEQVHANPGDGGAGAGDLAVATGGRFVATAPRTVLDLVTATDGREATIDLSTAVDPGTSAVLVAVTADVGRDGGVVRLGSGPDRYDQMLMWGPASPDGNQRRGLAIISTDATSAGYLRYDGGSVLTVEVLGYFTGPQAPPSDKGLYVPAGPRLLFEGTATPDAPLVIDDIHALATAALVNVTGPPGSSGHRGAAVVSIDDGSLRIEASQPVEAGVTLIGYFL